ncbi:hypothetical protein ABZP36_002983 [Zizania latifolia]
MRGMAWYVLEIQAMIPSTYRAPMWKDIIAAYLVTARCYLPITLVGYWTSRRSAVTTSLTMCSSGATRYMFGVPGRYWGGHALDEVHRSGDVSDVVCALQHPLLVGGLRVCHLKRMFSGDPGIVAYESSFLEKARCKDFVEAICPTKVLGK